MFVKLVRVAQGPSVSLDSGYATGVCAPQRVVVYDADSIEFEKHAALEENEPLGSPFGVERTYIPFDSPNNVDEYIDILFRKGDRSWHIFASGCSMYIMNDDGKTVDSEHCT